MLDSNLPHGLSHWLTDKRVRKPRMNTKQNKGDIQEKLIDPVAGKSFVLPALNSTRNLNARVQEMSPLGGASRRSTHDILLAVSGRPGGKPLVSSSTQIK